MLLAMGLAIAAACPQAMAEPAAPRLVSLSPSLTEIVVQIGREACLVGRSTACDAPASVKALPTCGDFGKPNLEAILALRPTHLVTAALEHPAAATTLDRAGVRVVILPTNRIDDYHTAVATLGEILGAREAAQAENRRMREALAAFRQEAQAVAPEARPLVYFEIWDSPPMTIGRDSHLHDLIELAGGRNLGANEPGGYFRCSAEWVIAGAPEVIIAPGMGKDRQGDIARRPGWGDIPAVRHGRIHTGLDADALYRLGPRLDEGIRILRACLHPGAMPPAGGATP